MERGRVVGMERGRGCWDREGEGVVGIERRDC